MAERTDQRTRNREADVDIDIDRDIDVGGLGDENPTAVTEDRQTTNSGSRLPSLGVRQRVGERVDGFFSARLFGLLLVVTTVLSFFAGAVVPLGGSLAGIVGICLALFLFGAARKQRKYLEVGLSSAFAGVLVPVLGNLLTLSGPSVGVVAIGATGSGIAGLLGYYFGRDFRDGLTRDV